jgi:acetate kinase
MMRNEKLTPEQMDEFVSRRCGLIGISESTSDMRELVSRRAHDCKAQEAVDLFCYQSRKWIGAYAAVLGGIETLVFSGGIGEHSPEVRAGICGGLGFLGIQVDPSLNRNCAGKSGIISPADSRAVVRVIPTDEEVMIAKIVFDLLARNTDQ